MIPIPKRLTVWLIATLLMIMGQQAMAQTGITVRKSLDGGQNALVANAAITVRDSAYFSTTDKSKLDTPYQVRNVISFKVNESDTVMPPSSFTASINVLLTYNYFDATNVQRQDTMIQVLSVNYDSTKPYQSRASFAFSGCRQVTAQVLSITVSNPAAMRALILDNEMTILPVYKLDRVADAVKNLRFASVTTNPFDKLTVNWDAVTGADEYDLEWTYIDSTALGRYGSPLNQVLLFRNNATRVTVKGNTYDIPMLYDDSGFLFIRVRAVQAKGPKARWATIWSSEAAGAAPVSFSYAGHERMLNWQSSVSFAEEGKRKAVIQYFDGSLRSRQTVTKDNVTNTAIVAETYYDYQGRPAIQVLPAPSLSSIIRYSRNFNTGANSAEYDRNRYDRLPSTPDSILKMSADSMSVFSGAAQYYSAANPSSGAGADRFIPDAQGYAFTETEYTQDNTGRISRQSGVGANYKLGSGQETKYTYGAAKQNELDAIFGTEAGDETHYFKNTVQDANGQLSVSYVDMHGRTIATALAGSPDNGSLTDLTNKNSVTVTDTLSGVTDNMVQDLVMTIKKTQQVEARGDYLFSYSLVPPVLQKKDCNNNNICYVGKYELEIKITDDAYNQRLAGKFPTDTIIRNFSSPAAVIPDCTAPQPIQVSFTLNLPKGNYEITKTLRISREAMDTYRDSFYLKSNLCTTLAQFVQQRANVYGNTNCAPDCASCLARIGSYQSFQDSYIAAAGIAPADSSSYRGQILKAYNDAVDACNALCKKSNTADDIRKTMLMDISAPSGQYAKVADSAYKYSIFFNNKGNTLPAFRNSSITYLNAAGQPDQVYDENSGTYVLPQNLQPKQFSDKFNPAWANALLPYHPEYQRLLAYESYKPSYNYDLQMQAIDNFNDASAAGFLNPLGDANDPYPINLQDSMINLSTTFKSNIAGKLSNYRNSGRSIWAIAMMSVLCPNGGNSCAANYASQYPGINTSTICNGDLNMIWRAFRELYLQAKRDYVQTLIMSVPGPSPSDTVGGKQLIFMNTDVALNNYGLGNPASIPSQAQAQAQGNDSINKWVDANCRANVDNWKRQLSACTNYSDAALTEITNALLAVCKDGGDIDHLYGASTVKPSSTATLRSFEDVIRDYNSRNGIALSAQCNPLLVNMPAPYDKQPALADKMIISKPAPCECERLSNLKLEFNNYRQPADVNLSAYLLRTRQLVITQSLLDSLSSACTPGSGCTFQERAITLPAALQCNATSSCATCATVTTSYNNYVAAYPGMLPAKIDTTDAQHVNNRLFATYMNNRLGLGKEAWQYLAFMDSCTRVGYDSVSVCNSVQTYTYFTGAGGGATFMAARAQMATLAGTPASNYISNAGMTITDMRLTKDKGYIIAGAKMDGSLYKQAYVIKTDAAGYVQWAKVYDGGSGQEIFTKIKETTDGGYIAIGNTTSYSAVGASSQAGMIAKLDRGGNVTWSKSISAGTTNGEDGRDVIQLSNGNYAFCGDYNVAAGTADWMVGVLKSNGDYLWTKQLGEPGNAELVYHVVENNDTLVVAGLVVGQSYYIPGVMKLDRNTGVTYQKNKYTRVSGDRKHDITGLFKTATGYRITVMQSDNWGSYNGDAAYLDINNAGAATAGYQLTKGGSGNTYGLASFYAPDGSMYLSPSFDITTQSYFLYKINANNTIAWANQINTAYGSGNSIARMALNDDNTIEAAGLTFNRGGLFHFGVNGASGCTDVPLSVTNNVDSYMDAGAFASSFVDQPIGVVTADFKLDVQDSIPYAGSESCAIGTCRYSYRGPLLCSSNTVFESTDPNVINNCSDNPFFAANAGNAMYNAYRDSLIGSFNQDYVNSCLQAAARESFTLTHQLSEYQYTLYYYDQAGNLVRTVPPAGVVVNRSKAWLDGVKAARAAGQVQTPAHTMSTVYRYNTLNQVVTQLSPDGGKSRFWYDRLGRLAISQNARQALTNAYSYTLYDALGRITEVGEISSSTAMSDAISRDATALQTWINNAGNSRAQITRTVYDAANWPVGGGMQVGNNVRNRVAYSAVYDKVADTATGSYASATFYSYDIHGNVDTLLQDYKKGGMADNSNRLKKITYDYDLISGKVNVVSYQSGQRDAVYHRYTYDAENRITNVETSRDSIYWENDAYYQYYKHGPLSRAVIGQQKVQGLDYAYTLQGWLKGVNSTTATAAYDMGSDGQSKSSAATDAFGYALHYNNSDYQSINTGVKPFASASVSAGFKPLYNGNIAAMSMQLPKVGEPLLYTYGYDALNRIIAMDANRTFNASTNTWTPTAINDFKERVSYDANGNILSYNRNGNNTFAGKPLGMDSLTYNYAAGKNRLDYIRDVVAATNYGNDIDNQSPGNYRYDSIGNMTSDVANGVDSIYWTVYGKISRIKKSNGTTIDYTYDVAGNRISKNVSGVQTWYVRDASGNVMSVYTLKDPAVNNGLPMQTEAHLYGSNRLGMSTLPVLSDGSAVPSVTRNGIQKGINVTFTRGNKLFELSNHLGNVLATVSDRRTAISLDGTNIDHYEPVITSAQEYYPFGSLMPGRGGHLSPGGWSSGSTIVNGYTLPESLTVSQRSSNQPSEYVATTTIDFTTGFDSNAGDNFDAYLADGSYAGGSSGAGSVANSGGGYRYGFNGKENDGEVKGEGNEQDYGKRVYDTRIGKFLSTDPLQAKYPNLTPYQFASNSPVAFIDVDGLEKYHYTLTFGEQGESKIQFSNTEHFSEWQWKPKSGGTMLGFQLWEKVEDPRKEYIVEYSFPDYLVVGVAAEPVTTIYKATFKSEKEALNVKMTDFEGEERKAEFAKGLMAGVDMPGIPVRRTRLTPRTSVERNTSSIHSGNPIAGEPARTKSNYANYGSEFIGEGTRSEPIARVGHTTEWAQMTAAERKAFQHSYSRHAAELGLPNWRQTEAASMQRQFNKKVSEIRAAGANNFFHSYELVNGRREMVSRTEPVINGEHYYYYETLSGKFISAGRMP
ncbi:RHS repeat-associated core domain-containing protein [Chitinophaga vietnamensis]|uniref:RHS repeat-associated core domain-containing protein n=1 Tax=Chitinophaga vietnamensis TaxID=2593957 RepID=UPI001177B1B2|nr:RHS repeat-associated core domain-containing protein [Chitinophaga vietnamensis]